MFYIFLTVLAGAIIALDQWTKWLTVNSLAIGEDLPSILGIFHITHTKNTGAAWGILQGQRWLFLLVMVAFVVVIVIMFRKKWLKKKVEWLCLASILGGGLGNMIDRLFRGAVTDMICLDFVRFPVFNVADCFITVGAIGLIVYVLFFDREAPHEVEG